MLPVVKDPADKTEVDLFSRLEKIDARLNELIAEGLILEPDQIMAELHEQTAAVRRTLDQIVARSAAWPEPGTNLSQLADTASREFLMSVRQPVIVKTTTVPGLPDLALDREIVLAIVLRALRLVAEQAGPGCHVHVQTLLQDGAAVLRVEATGPARLGEPSLPIRLRSISLADLVRELGGVLGVEQSRDRLCLELHLTVDARAH